MVGLMEIWGHGHIVGTFSSEHHDECLVSQLRPTILNECYSHGEAEALQGVLETRI